MQLHYLFIGTVTLIYMSNLVRCSPNRPRQHSEDIARETSHDGHPIRVSKQQDEFDIRGNEDENPSSHSDSLTTTISKGGRLRHHGRPGKIDHVNAQLKKKNKGRRRMVENEAQSKQERGWHYCSDGRRPKDLRDISNTTDYPAMGYMCRDVYPTSTCCYDHDLNMELVGDKVSNLGQQLMVKEYTNVIVRFPNFFAFSNQIYVGLPIFILHRYRVRPQYRA